MKKLYACFLRYTSSFKAKTFLAGCMLTIMYATAAAQDSAAITWGTAKHQPVSTHEVHGESVGGKLYIFGGYDVNKRPAFSPTKRAYVYDPLADTWKAIADLPHTPNGSDFGGITHEGLTTDSIDIYFAGGYTSNADGTNQLFGTKQVWKYNVAANNYTRLPDLPEELAAGQMRYLNGKLHYIAGADLSRQDVGVHYALDLNDTAAGWKTLAQVINPVNHPGSAVYDGKLYLIAGAHGQDNNTVTQKTVQVYDPNTDAWALLADLPVARDHISSAVVVMGDRIIVLGGEKSHNSISNLVSAYSPAADTWTELSPLPANKSAGVAGVADGNFYYAGGNFSNSVYKGIPEGVILSSEPVPFNSVDSLSRAGDFKKPVLYPNPLKTRFNIKFPVTYSGHFTFTITNQNGLSYNIGKVKIERGGSNVSFDISKWSLPAGVYFLKINSSAKSEELKMIIK